MGRYPDLQSHRRRRIDGRGGGAAGPERGDRDAPAQGPREGPGPPALPARGEPARADRGRAGAGRRSERDRGCGAALRAARRGRPHPGGRPCPDHRDDLDQPVPHHARDYRLARRRRHRDRHHQHAQPAEPRPRRGRHRPQDEQAAAGTRLLRPEDRPADAGALLPPRRRPRHGPDHLGQSRDVLTHRQPHRGFRCGPPDRGARRRFGGALRKHPLGRRVVDGALLHGRCRSRPAAPGAAARGDRRRHLPAFA